MADRIVLNTPTYKGEFLLEGDSFNGHEWRIIKLVSGYMPVTIGEGFRGGDSDLYVALAVIALVRAGRVSRDDAVQVADALRDAPVDGSAIRFAGDPEVADDDPPAVPAETPDENEQLPRSIGESGHSTSETRVIDLRNTGTHG